jgi:hypothetical protein
MSAATNMVGLFFVKVLNIDTYVLAGMSHLFPHTHATKGQIHWSSKHYDLVREYVCSSECNKTSEERIIKGKL